MFGHKSFLKIGPLDDASIVGLYKESYELESCSYVFSQEANVDGKAQTEVRGGTISVTIPGVPPMDIIQWSLDSRKYNEGVVVICDSDNMPLEKVNFKDAACISMEIVYSQQGKGYTATKLTLQARKISVGDTDLNNRWAGFND
jgi:hypothetical protein